MNKKQKKQHVALTTRRDGVGAQRVGTVYCLVAFYASLRSRPHVLNTYDKSLCLLDDELIDGPVLERAVREIPANDDRDLALAKLLHRDLERVRLALNVHHHRRVHADLQRTRAEHTRTLVLGHVLGGDAVGIGLLVRLVEHRHLLVLLRAFLAVVVELFLDFLLFLRHLLVVDVVVRTGVVVIHVVHRG